MDFSRFSRPSVFDFRRESSPNSTPANANANGNAAVNTAPAANGRQGEPPILSTEDAGPRLPPPHPTPNPTGYNRARSGAQIGPGGTIRGAPGGNGMKVPMGGGGRRDPVEDATFNQPADSLTLGQLKAATAGMPQKQKVQQFTYRYDDTDTIMSELNEFYPYEDMPGIAQGPEKFAAEFKGVWTETSLKKRREYIEIQLECLESSVRSIRRGAQERLQYLLHGCFAETTGPEMQLHWIIENAKTVRAVDGITSLVTALQDANRRYTGSAEKSDKPLSTTSNGPSSQSAQGSDDRNVELIDIIGMLYFTVEVLRTDDSFGDELMAMSTPLPLVLFQMIAGLKDRLPKGYPVKKVLLLMWKTILASLGGVNDVEKSKAFAREQAGLPPVNKKFFTKASPIDITNWRRDMSVKYTTFQPPPAPVEKLAEGIMPIPPRPDYHSTEIPSPREERSRPLAPAPNPLPQMVQIPGTPAVSPQLTSFGQQQQAMQNGQQPGKPKKQQFQTDPNRPFVFPFSSPLPSPSSNYLGTASGSRTSAASSSSSSTAYDPYMNNLVPYAIAEADKLFARHAYVSLGLFQLWQARDECMREERGLGKRGLIGFDDLSIDDEEGDEEDMEAMRLEWRFEEEETECKSRGDKEGAKKARERLMAARRLRRVDLIYKHTLPIMQSCVIVLLKFLLATVTGPGAAHMTAQGGAVPPGFQSPTQEIPQPEMAPAPPTRGEIDVARHREITSKAVSAILLLLLKWFKASHVLKFHFLAQLLFDSNCLLLVLKMFGLSDVYESVRTKNESEDLNFFRYCHLNCSKSPPRPEEDSLLQPQPQTSPKQPQEGDKDIEYITDYSWRNFFSSINFLKILQKMTKHRTHRTFMLNQYKSSQIFKRMLRANQPMLQLQVLKLVKSQMPWCGRKWRQTNMKMITAIYLNCRPDLKDDWLGGTDQDTEVEDALPQEYALRSLIVFYNRQNYSVHLLPGGGHKRSNSTSAMTLEDPALNPPPGQQNGHIHRSTSSSSNSERDVFPPRKTLGGDGDVRYNPDEMIEFWLHEYEDVLMEVFGDGETADHNLFDRFSGMAKQPHGDTEEHSPRPTGYRELAVGGAPGAAERDDPAWTRLDQIMRSRTGSGGDDDVISDSESIATVGDLGDDAQLLGNVSVSVKAEVEEMGDFARQQSDPVDLNREDDAEGDGDGGAVGKNTWEHMSPLTLSQLPPSPHERRRSSAKPSMSPILGQGTLQTTRDGQRRKSSSSSPLRPVIPKEKSSPRRPSAINPAHSPGLVGPSNLGPMSPGMRSPGIRSPGIHSPVLHSYGSVDPTLAGLGVGMVGRRRTSDGAGGGEMENPFDDDEGDEDDDDMPGPMPIERETTDQRERMGAVDEVEYAYGE